MDEPRPDATPIDSPVAETGPGRLPGYAQAYREALEITEAYRQRLKAAVLEEIDAGMTAPEAARLTGVSRVTVNSWRRWCRSAGN